MPKDYPRIELSLPPHKRRRLEVEKMEISARLGRSVSMNELLRIIIDMYFESVEKQEEERLLLSSQAEL